MRIFHSSGGYLVWIFETAHCDSFTLKLLIPQTDSETQALPDCIGQGETADARLLLRRGHAGHKQGGRNGPDGWVG
jgi:hypothetical protein